MAEPYIGQITMVGFDFAPEGWAKCDGTIIPINQNPALFSLLGDRYGGDGVSTFALPDMRGRVPVHRGILDNWRFDMGKTGGLETVVLQPNELPAHTHDLMASQDNADAYGPAQIPLLSTQVGKTPPQLMPLYNNKAPSVAMADDAINSAGEGLAHNNIQPVQVINFIIALKGIFPPRN